MIRYYYIQANRDKYPIAKMVRWAKVSRSGFYAWLRRKPSLRDKTNADLLQQIQKIHDENHHTYGSTRITRELRNNGYPVNHKRVERIMCEIDFRAKARRKFVSSMSCKGNCWDNAPMESFWGTLKQEWLNNRHFRTRDEAKAAIFEYIWIFYNRKRMHSSLDYTTPEKYYAARLVQELAA